MEFFPFKNGVYLKLPQLIFTYMIIINLAPTRTFLINIYIWFTQ